MLNFENLDKFMFRGIGKYAIPQIKPVTEYPQGDFLSMNYAKTEKNPHSKNLHCFVDDYQFIRYWNQPGRYIPLLQKFRSVCSPDFSIFYIHRYAAGYADIQPLSETLACSILAVAWYDGISHYFMEHT